jgi:hypothetical protein
LVDEEKRKARGLDAEDGAKKEKMKAKAEKEHKDALKKARASTHPRHTPDAIATSSSLAHARPSGARRCEGSDGQEGGRRIQRPQEESREGQAAMREL